jgi:hypothetical protein
LEKTKTGYSRRDLIHRAAIVTGSSAIVVAGLSQGIASAQAAKVAQSAAQYQTTPKAKAQCSGCVSFIAPSACKVVAGTISPSGWCSLYNAKA